MKCTHSMKNVSDRQNNVPYPTKSHVLTLEAMSILGHMTEGS